MIEQHVLFVKKRFFFNVDSPAYPKNYPKKATKGTTKRSFEILGLLKTGFAALRACNRLKIANTKPPKVYSSALDPKIS